MCYQLLPDSGGHVAEVILIVLLVMSIIHRYNNVSAILTINNKFMNTMMIFILHDQQNVLAFMPRIEVTLIANAI